MYFNAFYIKTAIVCEIKLVKRFDTAKGVPKVVLLIRILLGKSR